MSLSIRGIIILSHYTYDVIFIWCLGLLLVFVLLFIVFSVHHSVDVHVECVLFFRLFSFSVALPNTCRRSVSRPEQVRQAGSVGDQEQDAGIAILVTPRFHQGLYQTRPVPFGARKYRLSIHTFVR